MKKIFPFLFIILPFQIFSQNAFINGRISDAKTQETLVGVNIFFEDNTGVISDINGNYEIIVNPGKHKITFKYIGYQTQSKTLDLKVGEIKTVNIFMIEEARILDEIVVTAGKFEQKLSDVTVSMQVIYPRQIDNLNATSVEDVIQQVPGIMFMDDQASIRGGSGYSYGAGSRVLLLIDDLPLLTPASGEAKWDFVPLENIEQIEIIKGASSVLFGSSALNGVVNIRTIFPRNKPQTKVVLFGGFYDNPKREEIKWWSKGKLIFSGMRFSHARKAGNLDLVIGGDAFNDNGYRKDDSEQRYRFNINTRYRDKRIKGLSYGINTSYMKKEGENFLLWLDGDSGVYRPAESFQQEFIIERFNIDPYIIYYKNNSTRHSLRTRFLRSSNKNNTEQSNKDDSYYFEYQFQKKYKKDLTMTVGLTGTYTESDSEIYGGDLHFSSNGGIYSQFDKKFKKLSVSAGARWEGFRIDDDDFESRPVFRSGLNYQLKKYTFLRASFGQGYRYPTIAERYTLTTVGALNVFPNSTLKSEDGWSTEIGLMQGIKAGNWKGYIDIAGFWTEYHDMIEFSFGQHYPDSLTNPSPYDFFNYTGFKAFNITDARITGIDITITGTGKIFNLPLNIFAGYTYTNPVDLNADSNLSQSSTDSDMLKYRFYHSAKADVEIILKRFMIGLSLDYFSNIINIDKAFEDTLRLPNGTPIIQYGKPVMILPGLYEYRQKHNMGEFVLNLRFSYNIHNSSRISIIAKNILNREYMIRPGDVQAPRNIAVQYILKL